MHEAYTSLQSDRSVPDRSQDHNHNILEPDLFPYGQTTRIDTIWLLLLKHVQQSRDPPLSTGQTNLALLMNASATSRIIY